MISERIHAIIAETETKDEIWAKSPIIWEKRMVAMITKFSVKNFKNFKEKITWDLSQPCSYEFNSEAIENDCVAKGIIYGPNGSGKTNLGLAVFDIVLHLTDKNKLRSYTPYVNMDSKIDNATFEYTFIFDGIEVMYKYSKIYEDELFYEVLHIDGKEVLSYDFIENTGYTTLQGAETLNMLSYENPISRVKFIKSNAILEDNKINNTFYQFVNFVDKMLMFYSLDTRGYQGFKLGRKSITEGIIESGSVKDFENFLHEQDIHYELVVKEIDGEKRLFCKFENGEASFWGVASTGTRSLAIFYYWYIEMKSASFIYIDEFDAFYHFELAEHIIRKLKEIKGCQIFLSTHNTDLMTNDLLRPDCYFLINDNKIKTVSSSTEKELRKAHNLQKMYKAGAFNNE